MELHDIGKVNGYGSDKCLKQGEFGNCRSRDFCAHEKRCGGVSEGYGKFLRSKIRHGCCL